MGVGGRERFLAGKDDKSKAEGGMPAKCVIDVRFNFWLSIPSLYVAHD